MGVHLDGAVVRVDTLPSLAEIDPESYRAMAARNEENAGLNAAAGRYAGDDSLARKRDSLYSRTDFETVQNYVQTRTDRPPLRGVIFVQHGVTLAGGNSLRIVDGALVSDGGVHVGLSASLEIVHSRPTRTLPGLVTLDTGTLVVSQAARLRVHGLVYVNRTISIGKGAHVDIVGALLGNDPTLSVRNHAATVVIRYDPAVLGTPGLRAPSGPVVAWVAAWEELP
jgi:hypothetical protein